MYDPEMGGKKIARCMCVCIKSVIARKEKNKCVCVSVCMHVCRARAYVPYVRVLNQYLHSACCLSWVSHFDRIFFHMVVMYVKVYMYSLFTVQPQFICSSILLDRALGS